MTQLPYPNEIIVFSDLKSESKVKLNVTSKNLGLHLMCRNRRVFVANLDRNSEAAVYMHLGDRIVTINGRKVESIEACETIIKRFIARNKKWLTVSDLIMYSF